MNGTIFFKRQVYDWGWFQNTGSHTRTKITPELPPPPPPPPVETDIINSVLLASFGRDRRITAQPTTWTAHQVRTLTSLHIYSVSQIPPPCALNEYCQYLLIADSDVSDHAGLMPRLISLCWALWLSIALIRYHCNWGYWQVICRHGLVNYSWSVYSITCVSSSRWQRLVCVCG